LGVWSGGEVRVLEKRKEQVEEIEDIRRRGLWGFTSPKKKLFLGNCAFNALKL